MRARAIGRRASIGRKAPRTDQGSVVPRSVRVWLFSVKNSQGFLGAFERRSPLGRQILSRPIHVKSQKRQGRPKRARFAAAAVLRRPFQGTRDRIRIVSSKYALRKVDCVAPLGDRRGPVAPCSSGCSARGLSLLAHKHLRLYFLDSKRLAFDSQMPGCSSLRQDSRSVSACELLDNVYAQHGDTVTWTLKIPGLRRHDHLPGAHWEISPCCIRH